MKGVLKMTVKEKYTIDDLLEIVRLLRGENGCPWDKVQTHESMKKSMIEEAYEVIDALDNKDDKMFANELGDVLLQVVFHAVIAEEREAFDFEGVLKEVCDKLITRHTHVFGPQHAGDEAEALVNWEANKKKEKGQKSYSEMIRDIPKGLPALMSAEKVQKKAKSSGFDWDNTQDVFAKLREEIDELEQAYSQGERENICEEYGDVLFSMVNLGRFLEVTPEIELMAATKKFTDRFCLMEEIAGEENHKLDDLSLEQMEKIWVKIKKMNKKVTNM